MGRLVNLLWVLAAVFAGAPLASAWGADGHRIVCEIAWQEATPAARVAVREILREDPARDFASACNWADQVKYEKSHEWSRPWHYIGTHQDADTPDIAADCSDDGCAVSAIILMVGILRGGDDQGDRINRAEALKLLGHLVGDLHQPLHAGHAEDLGGNTIDVTFLGDPSTLHRVWDSGILRAGGLPWREKAALLQARLPGRDGLSLDPLVWADESYDLARGKAYDVPTDRRLDESWAHDLLPVVDGQLALAAARLAALLDTTLGSDPLAAGAPPFWVGSRRGTTRHYPECQDALRIVAGNLVTYEEPPADRPLHRGCPR